MQPKPFSHSFGESNFHIVFSPKYRYAVLTGRIAYVCDRTFERIARDYGFATVAKRVLSEHTHHFVSLAPWQSPSWIVQRLKALSAKKIFETFPYLRFRSSTDKRRFWGGEFWSDGYFFRSIGSTTDRAVEFYIRVANDPTLRKQYYSFSGGKSPAKREDPYVSFLQGDLKLPLEGQQTISRFLNARHLTN